MMNEKAQKQKQKKTQERILLFLFGLSIVIMTWVANDTLEASSAADTQMEKVEMDVQS
ncbi:hypothetical protein [Natribacillus halophilus]|uniref:Uncharacterized protein n=1 Tax=Natribacillus halophilus TaxID=549003 RepID=A0A1G8PUQ9_9BACI|nr:hypothetical protein [Natribacillus halophilus]SDI96098.1 hypothetical protein SAMN04488123_109116 [Natribacillus halophilus]